jgi:hypothetical protein
VKTESVVGPNGLTLTYRRCRTDDEAHRAAPAAMHSDTVTGVVPGGLMTEVAVVDDDDYTSLSFTITHDDVRHDVLTIAPPGTARSALWAALDLIAPIGGWRLRSEHLADAHRLLERADVPLPDTAFPVAPLLDDARFTAALQATHMSTAVLMWHQQGLDSGWVISGELTDAARAATVVTKADEHHIDLWTTDAATLAASITQRLERCGGTVRLHERTYELGSVTELIEALGAVLAA